MQSLLRRGTSFLSGSTKDKPDGFTTVSSHDALFPKVDPAVDGEDCDKDCATCTVRYPAKFDIDTKDKLYGHVDGWATHLLVATGKSDWVRDVADEKGSVMEAIEKHAIKPRNGVSVLQIQLACISQDKKKHSEEKKKNCEEIP